jgi:hypothetical protein
MTGIKHGAMCALNPAVVGYTFVRHIGLILDELSCQGLNLWQDDSRRWQWRWMGTMLQSERGFWALGEAIVDAVATRYPDLFSVETFESE